MTKTLRLSCHSLLASLTFAVLLPCLPARGQTPDAAALAKAVAKAHGFGDMSKISEIDFTFHAKSPAGKVDRTWQWFPKTDEVIFIGKDPSGKRVTLPYARKKVATLPADDDVRIIDGWFVDDGFWIFMPLHLLRDAEIALTVTPSTAMPMSARWATELTVEYPSDDPNVPGDRFHLFVDSTNLIREWEYGRRSQTPSRTVNKWEDYQPFGPLTVSLTRPPQDSKGLKVWFTDVLVRMAE